MGWSEVQTAINSPADFTSKNVIVSRTFGPGASASSVPDQMLTVKLSPLTGTAPQTFTLEVQYLIQLSPGGPTIIYNVPLVTATINVTTPVAFLRFPSAIFPPIVRTYERVDILWLLTSGQVGDTNVTAQYWLSEWIAPTSSGAAEKDWTDTERSQIRQRLGLDGTTDDPVAVPTLGLETDVQSSISAVAAMAADAGLETTVDAIITALDTLWTEKRAEPSMPADGQPLSTLDLLYSIYAGALQNDITGTTKTNRRLDGVSVRATYEVDDADRPTSCIRTP